MPVTAKYMMTTTRSHPDSTTKIYSRKYRSRRGAALASSKSMCSLATEKRAPRRPFDKLEEYQTCKQTLYGSVFVCVCVFTASRAVFYYIQVTFCIFKNLFFYFLNLQQINNFSSFIFIFFINFISSFFFEKKNYVNLFVNFLTFLSSFISY